MKLLTTLNPGDDHDYQLMKRLGMEFIEEVTELGSEGSTETCSSEASKSTSCGGTSCRSAAA